MYSDEELENASHQIMGLAGFEPATNGFLHYLRAFSLVGLKASAVANFRCSTRLSYRPTS